MREVWWRLRVINERNSDKLKFDAKIHGLDLKIPGQKKKEDEVKLTEDQERSMQEALKIAMARKQKEYGRKISNSNSGRR